MREQYKLKINKLIDSNLNKVTYLDYLMELRKKAKYFCIFGTGMVGKTDCEFFHRFNIKVDFFCDNNSNNVGKVIKNVPYITYENLIYLKEDTVIFIATGYIDEIYGKLIEQNFKEVLFLNEYRLAYSNYYYDNKEEIRININQLLDIVDDEDSFNCIYKIVEGWFDFEFPYTEYLKIKSDLQYFVKDIIKLSDNEKFVDVGAYTGDTINVFLEQCSYKFEKIYAFEIDTKIAEILQNNIQKLDISLQDKIKIFQNGLYNEYKKMKISAGDSSSCIQYEGEEEVVVDRLDSVISEEVTLIKMDIEGAELDALQGATETIQKYKPKLAICIYHNPAHMWEIPLYIKELVPEYRVFIRHHTNLPYETVCYAVI